MKRLISKKGLEKAYRAPKEPEAPREWSKDEYLEAVEALPNELFEIIGAVVSMLEDAPYKEEKNEN